jgi:hypothetical protein
MNLKIFFHIMLLLFLACSFFKDTITIKTLIGEKEKIDKSDNPAFKYIKTKKLTEKRVSLKDVLVKDIRESEEIYYKYCVIAEADSDKGKLKIYIYSKDVGKISKLTVGQSRIGVIGDFLGFHKEYEFFKKDDESYYSKIDLVDADILLASGESGIKSTESEESKSDNPVSDK